MNSHQSKKAVSYFYIFVIFIKTCSHSNENWSKGSKTSFSNYNHFPDKYFVVHEGFVFFNDNEAFCSLVWGVGRRNLGRNKNLNFNQLKSQF